MNEDKNHKESMPRYGLTVVAVVILAMVGYQIYSGVALKKVGIPGWFEIELFPPEKPTPPPLPPQPELTREFMIGRWQVEQSGGPLSGGTIIDYEPDGTFSGTRTIFTSSGVGLKQPLTGRWDVNILSKDKFRLQVDLNNKSTWVGPFKVIDADHLHNIAENYVTVRMK